MRILIIRHGDPDYVHDSLTEKGWREAELLKNRLIREPMSAIYCSPLGRAQATAQPTLTALGRTAETCDWLQEFDGKITDPRTDLPRGAWDLYPADWTQNEALYDPAHWIDADPYCDSTVPARYHAVCDGLDALLARHGYVHDGCIFRVIHENTDTIALFCHFGVECVLLSHLLHISPVALWHGFVALPTSVTILSSEEREQGIAYFRCSHFGDLSHLYAGGEPESFAARFCETFSNDTQRH